MRKCKIKGCNRKHEAKGYCAAHYLRKLSNRIINPTCKNKNCKNKVPLPNYFYCSTRCSFLVDYQRNKEQKLKYKKENYSVVPRFGNKTKGQTTNIYTNGVTEEIKPLISKIKNKVLEDCIKNPRKYLGEREEQK